MIKFKQIFEDEMSDNKKLESILRKEMEPLRIQYLKQTEEWADRYFDHIKKQDEYYIHHSSPKNYTSTNEYYRAEKLHHGEWSSILRKGKSKYITLIKKQAEEHYENSIQKLTDRISKKELNIDMLTVKTSHINVHIETILTDGIKTVRAWTIIAEGPIQRPHYRYLVK